MIRWLGRKEQPERPHHPKEVRDTYRAVFSSREGREALAYILVDLGFFDDAIDRETGEALSGEALVRYMALQGFARRLLEQIGAWHEFNVDRIVDTVMNVPVWDAENSMRGNHGSE